VSYGQDRQKNGKVVCFLHPLHRRPPSPGFWVKHRYVGGDATLYTHRAGPCGHPRPLQRHDTKQPLGSFIEAPIIDLLASFIGMPRLISNHNGTEEVVASASRTISDSSDKVLDLHRAALRDGSA